MKALLFAREIIIRKNRLSLDKKQTQNYLFPIQIKFYLRQNQIFQRINRLRLKIGHSV